MPNPKRQKNQNETIRQTTNFQPLVEICVRFLIVFGVWTFGIWDLPRCAVIWRLGFLVHSLTLVATKPARTSFGLPRFHVDRDRDVLSQHLRVGRDAEIAALDRGRGFPAGEHLPLHALAEAEGFYRQDHRLGDALDRQ